MFELGLKQKEWLKVLRSGEYIQGVCALSKQHHDGYRYCCLGVANKIFNFEETDNGYLVDTFHKLGLRDMRGRLKDKFYINDIEIHSLSSMNDNGCSFNEIADYIEQNPENVFAFSV